MKKLLTIGFLIIGMCVNAQVATNNTTASGDVSTAMGYQATASGNTSTAMGSQTIANGVVSTAMGYKATASGNTSTSMGSQTTASGVVSTSMGYKTTASGNTSTSMGSQTTASGDYSTAMGYRTTASGDHSVSIGLYNKSNTAGNGTAFVIGNGTADNVRSDAFKVMFNGDATVSKDLIVNGELNTTSDARLKMNIMSLGGTLAKLLLIDGKSYTTKKDGRQTIGVLAQDIQQVFPELVTTDDNDMLAVNYQGLVPVLINALKEQDEKLQVQDERLARLEAIIADMNK